MIKKVEGSQQKITATNLTQDLAAAALEFEVNDLNVRGLLAKARAADVALGLEMGKVFQAVQRGEKPNVAFFPNE